MLCRGLLLFALLSGIVSPIAASEPQGLIAFSSRDEYGGYIYVMNADGTGHKRLSDGHQPAWSPDGERIAFWSGGGIYIMNRDGSGVALLADEVSECYGRPVFSPDGGQILFAGQLEDECFLFTMDAVPGTPASQIPLFPSDPKDHAYHGSPAWGPDGSILFEFGRPSQIGTPNTGNVYRANVDGSDIVMLSGGIGQNSAPAWSPDSNRIAFYSHRENGEGIYLIDPDGSNLQLLSPSWAIDWHPSWSPDGEWITFVSSQSRKSQDIFIMRADGSEVTNLTELRLEEDFDPAWSPVALPRLQTAVPEISWGHVKHR